jgi:hypothetical protein
LPTAAAGSSQAPTAAVDKAAPRLSTAHAFGAPVTHPALRAAWITGLVDAIHRTAFHADGGHLRYDSNVTPGHARLPAITVEHRPRSRWNAARHRVEWVSAISGIRSL